MPATAPAIDARASATSATSATPAATDPRAADALLAGATGLVGRELMALWQGPGTLHLLLRRPPDASFAPGPRHRVHVVDFAALPALPPAATALCALGTTIKAAGSKAAFRAVDFDAVLAFARAARAAGVRRFGVVSALGASRFSGNFYSHTKGEMEDAVEKIGFESLVIARPSLLAGARHATGQPPRAGEALALAITMPLSPFIPKPYRPIQAAAVARALVAALAEGRPGTWRISSGEMQDLGRAPRP